MGRGLCALERSDLGAKGEGMKRTEIARRLRREMTDAERKLWSRLRGGQVRGLKFRRQMPLGGFIADFACVAARVVIEVDGGQHAEQVESDRLRSEAIEGAGYIVVRFWNDDVLTRIDDVMDEIDGLIAARQSTVQPHPSRLGSALPRQGAKPSPFGRGGHVRSARPSRAGICDGYAPTVTRVAGS